MINAGSAENMRVLLFVLLIVAIFLILLGAVIALWTLYGYRKMRLQGPERLPGE